MPQQRQVTRGAGLALLGSACSRTRCSCHHQHCTHAPASLLGLTLLSSFSSRTLCCALPGSSLRRQMRRKSPVVANKSGRVPSCERGKRNGMHRRGRCAGSCTGIHSRPAEAVASNASAPCQGQSALVSEGLVHASKIETHPKLTHQHPKSVPARTLSGMKPTLVGG